MDNWNNIKEYRLLSSNFQRTFKYLKEADKFQQLRMMFFYIVNLFAKVN